MHDFSFYDLRIISGLLGLKLDIEVAQRTWFSLYMGQSAIYPTIQSITEGVVLQSNLVDEIEKPRIGLGGGLNVGWAINSNQGKTPRHALALILGIEWLELSQTSLSTMSLNLGYRWR